MSGPGEKDVVVSQHDYQRGTEDISGHGMHVPKTSHSESERAVCRGQPELIALSH